MSLFAEKGLLSAAAFALAAVLLTACDRQSVSEVSPDTVCEPFNVVTKVTGKTFGTFYYITVPGGYPGGEDALRLDAEGVFKRISDAISTFDKDAELARFNSFESTDSFIVSNYLATVAEEVFRQARRIDLAMDPTVGPLVNLWGFGPEGAVTVSPSAEEIAAVKEYVGLDKVSLRYAGNDMHHVAYLVKTDPRVRLDFSTVGEGIAADELAALFDEKGIENYMVAVAGAIRTRGANPEGKMWGVGIEDPMQKVGVFAKVCPDGMAVSTAGSYRNFFIDDKTGEFFSHIIDPVSGYPVDNRTVSVTVVDRSALVTDALDTGLLVLGAEEAVKWGDNNNVAVYAIKVNEKKQPEAVYSKAFAPYLKCVYKPPVSPVRK